ncbi:EF-P beta-lysylation protein EpmB [bacterium]|nr:EF-P beta-lysylation protein EpmB [bacterium]
MQTADDRQWKRSLARAIRDPAELLCRLEVSQSLLPDGFLATSREVATDFPLLVPESYLGRMRRADPADPLLRQVLPIGEERRSVQGFSLDAVEDVEFRRSPGLLQKYAGRALLIAAGSCAVHCRYCFRRHYPYGDEPRRLDAWESAFRELEADTSITEVLLSGGDPLMLTDERLSEMVERLSAIPHLRRLRIHTRLPIVLPDRVTGGLLRILAETRLTPAVVVHANHAAELVDDCADSLQRLRATGLLVLNQAVLLRGVNDSVDALADLSESLIDLGVTPYYLHQLDRVAGAAHFEVPVARGRRLIHELRKRLPGYLVPRYVQEIAGEPYKTVID